MKGWLVDTNVVSELRRPAPDQKVLAWSDAQSRASLYLSVVTIMEVRFGAEIAGPAKKTQLEAWIDQTLRPWYGNRILATDEDVWLTWRRMQDRGRKRGHVFGQPDLFIAAQAEVFGLCVVSRDTGHYIAAGVPVLDPWRMEFIGPGAAPKTVMQGSLAEIQSLLT